MLLCVVDEFLKFLFPLAPQAVVGNMMTEIDRAPLPIMHYGIDLWQSKTSGLKYIGVHLFYIDGNFELKHKLIAVS